MRAFASGLAGGLTALGLMVLLTAQTWISGAGALPANAIVLTDQSSCPTGTTELTAARGRYLVGNPASGTVGTTLGTAITNGADASYTPAGTNGTSATTATGTIAWPAGVPTFSGAALATHQHESVVGTSADPRIGTNFAHGTAGSTVFTAYTVTAAADTSMTKQLVSATSAGTPGGTIAWPAGVPTFSGSSSTVSAQTFTGTASTTMRSTVSPYLQLLVCKS